MSASLPGSENPNFKHGLKGTPIYNRWMNMRRRCHDPNDKQWRDYGARGITVCERWRNDVAAFHADMGQPPSRAHSIERKDNNKGYDPDNCVWATMREQCNNRRSSKLYTHDGRTQSIAQWARECGSTTDRLWKRLRGGLSIAKALSPASFLRHKMLSLNGRSQTLPAWAKELGVKESTLWGRIQNGWSDEDVLRTPVIARSQFPRPQRSRPCMMPVIKGDKDDR